MTVVQANLVIWAIVLTVVLLMEPVLSIFNL